MHEYGNIILKFDVAAALYSFRLSQVMQNPLERPGVDKACGHLVAT